MKQYRVKPKVQFISSEIIWCVQAKLFGIWMTKTSYYSREKAIEVADILQNGTVCKINII